MAGLGQLDHNVEANNGGGGNYTLLVEDDYEIEIVESDVKANSKGTGQNLDLKLQVVSGTGKGATFYHSITSIQHESAQAQAIGQGQLKSLCLAAGIDFTTLSDSEQLHFRPFWAHVIQDTYFSTKKNADVTVNRIGKFLYEGMPEDDKPAASNPPAQKHQASKPAPAAEPAAKKRPWDR